MIFYGCIRTTTVYKQFTIIVDTQSYNSYKTSTAYTSLELFMSIVMHS